jgi:hypothetical protein
MRCINSFCVLTRLTQSEIGYDTYAIDILFSIFIEQKWRVVNVSHVNECVRMYNDYIGVFPVRNYCVRHAQNTIKLLRQQRDTQWFPWKNTNRYYRS